MLIPHGDTLSMASRKLMKSTKPGIKQFKDIEQEESKSSNKLEKSKFANTPKKEDEKEESEQNEDEVK